MSSTRLIRGYATATCDLPHAGHFYFFQRCKLECDHLTIGLTSDKVATVQKRRPFMPIEQRSFLVGLSEYVDNVVVHHGEPKAEAYESYQFDVLFSSEEYLGCSEFMDFQLAMTERVANEEGFIPPSIRFLPRTPGVSTTDLMIKIEDDMVCNSSSVIATTMAGAVQKLPWSQRIVKPIHYTPKESMRELTSTSDIENFDQFEHQPRNIKGAARVNEFPNIAGVSPGRELSLNLLLSHDPDLQHTNLYEKHVVAYADCVTHKSDTKEQEDEELIFTELGDFARYVAHNRMYAGLVVHMVLANGGVTFREFSENADADDIRTVHMDVLQLCRLLCSKGIVHGDIHPDNILVKRDANGIITTRIIDWGWATYDGFDMTEREIVRHQSHLLASFDERHYRQSLEEHIVIKEVVACGGLD